MTRIYASNVHNYGNLQTHEDLKETCSAVNEWINWQCFFLYTHLASSIVAFSWAGIGVTLYGVSLVGLSACELMIRKIQSLVVNRFINSQNLSRRVYSPVDDLEKTIPINALPLLAQPYWNQSSSFSQERRRDPVRLEGKKIKKNRGPMISNQYSHITFLNLPSEASYETIYHAAVTSKLVNLWIGLNTISRWTIISAAVMSVAYPVFGCLLFLASLALYGISTWFIREAKQSVLNKNIFNQDIINYIGRMHYPLLGYESWRIFPPSNKVTRRDLTRTHYSRSARGVSSPPSLRRDHSVSRGDGGSAMEYADFTPATPSILVDGKFRNILNDLPTRRDPLEHSGKFSVSQLH